MSESNNEIQQLKVSEVTDDVSLAKQTLSAEHRDDLSNQAEQIIDSAIGRAALSISTEQVDSNFLNNRYGRGYSKTNLKSFRKFYKVYSDEKGQKPSDLFGLSWSHYQPLMQVGSFDARDMPEVANIYIQDYSPISQARNSSSRSWRSGLRNGR